MNTSRKYLPTKTRKTIRIEPIGNNGERFEAIVSIKQVPLEDYADPTLLVSRVYRNGEIYEVVKPKDSL